MRSFLTYLGLLGLLTLAGCGECRQLDCQNEGFCSDGECICQKWYSGPECTLKFNRNYEGVYYGTFEFSNGLNYRAADSLELSAAETPNVLMTNLGFEIEFISDSTLNIPEQVVNTSTESFTYSGEGSYDVNILHLEFDRINNDDQQYVRIEFEGDLVERER